MANEITIFFQLCTSIVPFGYLPANQLWDAAVRSDLRMRRCGRIISSCLLRPKFAIVVICWYFSRILRLFQIPESYSGRDISYRISELAAIAASILDYLKLVRVSPLWCCSLLQRDNWIIDRWLTLLSRAQKHCPSFLDPQHCGGRTTCYLSDVPTFVQGSLRTWVWIDFKPHPRFHLRFGCFNSVKCCVIP